MRIQFMGGGLANQILEFVFARFIERHFPGDTLFFDDAHIFTYPCHNGYELESVFGIKLNLLSKQIDRDTWNNIINLNQQGVYLPQILMNMGLPTILVSEYPAIQFPFSGEKKEIRGFQPNVIELPYSNIYYQGVWLHKGWFASYKKENLEELIFPPITDDTNLKYMDQICSTMSVGIHIRRGVFISTGLSLPNEHYKNACQSVLEKMNNVRFFVFSDDLEWCKKNASDLGLELTDKVTFVSGNIDGKNYIDMQLMSMCRGIIRPAQSTFSQVAGWLNRNLEFEILLGESTFADL